MSQQMPKDGKVYISRNTRTRRHWHVSDECTNWPANPKKVDREIAEDWYTPCGLCTDESDPEQHESNQADYECVECGKEDRLGVTGVRTLHACSRCEDITSWERLD